MYRHKTVVVQFLDREMEGKDFTKVFVGCEEALERTIQHTANGWDSGRFTPTILQVVDKFEIEEPFFWQADHIPDHKWRGPDGRSHCTFQVASWIPNGCPENAVIRFESRDYFSTLRHMTEEARAGLSFEERYRPGYGIWMWTDEDRVQGIAYNDAGLPAKVWIGETRDDRPYTEWSIIWRGGKDWRGNILTPLIHESAVSPILVEDGHSYWLAEGANFLRGVGDVVTHEKPLIEKDDYGRPLLDLNTFVAHYKLKVTSEVYYDSLEMEWYAGGEDSPFTYLDVIRNRRTGPGLLNKMSNKRRQNLRRDLGRGFDMLFRRCGMALAVRKVMEGMIDVRLACAGNKLSEAQIVSVHLGGHDYTRDVKYLWKTQPKDRYAVFTALRWLALLHPDRTGMAISLIASVL